MVVGAYRGRTAHGQGSPPRVREKVHGGAELPPADGHLPGRRRLASQAGSRMSAPGDRPGTVDILGCTISMVDMAATLHLLERLLASGGKHQVVCMTVNSI